ncbi:hypothetical protein [Nocardiopsis sp. L17-MgMaSL7]|uniref:hypothetical protein n=1 Tax=Nocardiopsis sp. L17-MgMaSL7 TaxID=1938893 RepID=UPI000D719557|nr:hypothetical protein [Nocardiopsis sp. L17-MgMaSL7]PWV51058.1 hypothetical protein BDW27_107124 [Nocardiopsis sp. L17-MgMaSL7]
MTELITVWQRSTVAELSWTSSSGPSGIPVVPLMWRDTPCVALPYSMAGTALSLRGRTVAFSVSAQDAGGRSAVVGTGPVEVVEDLDGSEFVEHLVEQEAIKHPPTRLRADSLIARRENWWWVPRLIVSLTSVEEQRELHPRTRAEDALLVRDRSGRPEVEVVTAKEWSSSGGLTLWARGGAPLEGRGEPAFVFAHQYSPDFERWERWSRSGLLTGDSLTVTDAEGAPVGDAPSGPLSPYGLLERLSNHRSLARTCRSAIAQAESRRDT